MIRASHRAAGPTSLRTRGLTAARSMSPACATTPAPPCAAQPVALGLPPGPGGVSHKALQPVSFTFRQAHTSLPPRPYVSLEVPGVQINEALLPKIEMPTDEISIFGVPHRPIPIDALRAGDIGFDYRREKRTWKQSVISLGEKIQMLARRERVGNSNFLHAFIVLETMPTLGLVRIADAAVGDAPYGVRWADINFATGHLKYAYIVFYRFADPRLQRRIASVARSWVPEPEKFVPNFSFAHAIRSVWQPRGINLRVEQQLLHLARISRLAKPPTEPDGVTPHQMMCSEFVTDVGAAATMFLYCDDHPGTHLGDPQCIAALRDGVAGNVFDANPGSLTPSALARRLATDSKAGPVGFVYTRV